MKKIFLISFIAAAILFSCSKEGEQNTENQNTENLCPVVEASTVPQVVKDSFAVRYPATIVTTWFYKDSSSYCALFTESGVEKLAHFNTNGTFIKEEVEMHQEGEHQDSTVTGGKPTTGCECEVHKEGD